MPHPRTRNPALTAIRAGYDWTGRRFVELWDFIAHDHFWATIAAISLLMAVLIATSCTSSSDSSPDPITTQVLKAEPDADTNDIAADIDYIKIQEPDASDAQIAGWIIEVIQWNNCLDANPTGEGCTEISPDNPRNW